MLYDPSCKPVTTKQNPTFEGFIRFLESKPADESYNYIDAMHCACAQYSHSIGWAENEWVTDYSVTNSGRDTWTFLNHIASLGRPFGSLWATFGTLLRIAKEIENES